MPCTEAYREHIMYTFSGYCKTVIRFAALLRYAVRQLSSPMGSLPPHCLSSVLMGSIRNRFHSGENGYIIKQQQIGIKEA